MNDFIDTLSYITVGIVFICAIGIIVVATAAIKVIKDYHDLKVRNREDAQNETHSGRFPMSDKPETATVLRPTHDDIALAEKVLDEAECRELPDRIADLIASTRAAERERCARRVERFFAPRSGALERRYGVTLADHIREGT